jgi:hypothetical protein
MKRTTRRLNQKITWKDFTGSMKLARNYALLLCMAVLATIGGYTASAQGMPDKDIFHWVSRQLNVNTDYPFPLVLVIDKEELAIVWRKKNTQSYQSWVENFGESKARETMDQLLNELLGLFDPKTKIIYVGNFMESCKTDAILAHEITHYLQHMQDGPGDPESEDFDLLYIYRELQADQIEKEFFACYCSPSK